jgi:hypothetical protein
VRGTDVQQAKKNVPPLKRCRIAILKKGTMTVESPKTKPDKSPKTKAELEALVLAELRAASGCDGAVHVMVVSYDDYRLSATWEVTSCNPGTSARNTVSARCVTSCVASSSILISHRPKEIIQWQ